MCACHVERSEAKSKHDKYLLFVDYQYYMIKKVEKWIYRFYLRSKRARFNVFNLYLMENPYLA